MVNFWVVMAMDFWVTTPESKQHLSCARKVMPICLLYDPFPDWAKTQQGFGRSTPAAVILNMFAYVSVCMS